MTELLHGVTQIAFASVVLLAAALRTVLSCSGSIVFEAFVAVPAEEAPTSPAGVNVGLHATGTVALKAGVAGWTDRPVALVFGKPRLV